MTMSSSSSGGGAFRLRWDVFLSFRGEDTRECFTKKLYESLHKQGVRAFMDDEGLDRGDHIATTLLEAIDDSAASIVIISPNYADSHWCLDELNRICDLERLIIPVFYKVDPSHVRKQLGPFQDGFNYLEKRFANEKDKILKWRDSMLKIGGLAGFVFNSSDDGDHENLIRRLVKRVLKELSNTPMVVSEFAVGINERVEKVINLLQLQSNNVKVLGLYGMGGVGKTTLAKALFNSFVGRFERRCFISNVRQFASKDDGLVSIQNNIIKDLSSQEGTRSFISDVKVGISTIKRIVRENRVLLVLDDVDHVNQLDALIGKREWFHEGSCIIITTRDTTVLPEKHVNELYEVTELYAEEALELFSYHALRKKDPPPDFLSFSKQIVSLTGRMPLALEVFGCFLFGKRRVDEWEDVVKKLKTIRPGNLHDVLKISYDGLDEQEKCIFLDIACFFVQMGMKRDDVIDVLRGCGFRGEIATTVLVEKCLIKVREDNTLWMHDQIRDMGRQIVLDENHVDPGMRSRLWDRAEIMSVLKSKKGTRCIQGIVLDFKERSNQWSKNYPPQPQAEKYNQVMLDTKSFEPMVSLRLLQINNLSLEGKFLPDELKWLQWRGCPLECISLDTLPRELAVLDLSNGQKIKSLWGLKSQKVPENLMVMNLSNCYQLAAIPDLSWCLGLEKINLANCINLTRIHESIGSLTTLRNLNLTRCENLIELPSDVSGLKHLESLILSECSKLKALPENIGMLKSLKTLAADKTAIVKLPESIFRLTKLERLVLDRCSHLRRLPDCIGKLCALQELSLYETGLQELPNTVGFLKNLEKLSLMGCEGLTLMPDSIGNLESLTELLASNSGIKELPSTIGSLSYLRTLLVRKCKLSKLPDSFKTLASIIELDLDGTYIRYLPDQIGELKQLRKLEIGNCSNLESLPESIGYLTSLNTLNIINGNIRELPVSIGLLENLVNLTLSRCRMLKQLPASIGNLKSLCHLKMEETAMVDLPESFGMLSSLRTLRMAKRPHLVPISVKNTGSFVLPPSFCNLTLLHELDARAWRLSGKIPDDFEKLSLLETLKLDQNNFHSLPSSLKGLSILKELSLPNCTELISLPLLPSSLIKLNASNCYALETIHDMSSLESLEELELTNCEKVADIPGLECLKSLKRLYLSGCNACSSKVCKRLSKVALRNFENLSMPGTKLPEWFSGETVSFSNRKNLELTSVVVGVVVSINHNIHIPIKREEMPGIIDVEGKVFKHGKQKFGTTLNIRGVPRTNVDHIHLCRFQNYHQLVAFLKDADTFCVTTRSPPFDKGLRLKKCGVYLIFEGDDDYDGDEESLDKGLQSVSERLARFFNTCNEGVDATCATESEDECQHELEHENGEPGTRSLRVEGNYIILCLFSLLFLLFSWFWLRCMPSAERKD
ncbi:disease resistance protein RPV1 isoform X2 [Medicago truncatula]|uniref:Disease resistance protein (TIR-NBS-LRR class), putative n=2 Tax=Medicago truncatula TaxID=3880 RepID=G7LDU5_MEDTR|nr:disease resistance protein RPV1 isoform X2 [Medicago truncatula]AET03053.1 disease resistance protein (TIR-NBS-LRR class), putative [Medicago truncatula]